jgi:hypothetical protein
MKTGNSCWLSLILVPFAFFLGILSLAGTASADNSELEIYFSPSRNLFFHLQDAQGRKTGFLPQAARPPDKEETMEPYRRHLLPLDVWGVEDIPGAHVFDANSMSDGPPETDQPEERIPQWSILLKPVPTGEFELVIRGKVKCDFGFGVIARPYGTATPVQTWAFRGVIGPGREYHYRMIRPPSYPMVFEFTPVNYLFQGFDPPLSREKTLEAAVGDKIRISCLLARRDGGPDSDAEAHLFLKKEKEGAEPMEARSADGPERGNRFLYSFLKPAERGRFTFRWDTSGLSTGVWKLIVRMDDGIEETALVKLH